MSTRAISCLEPILDGPRIPVASEGVPFGTSMRAVTLPPLVNATAFGVAVRAPVVPLIPDTSTRISFAVRITPDAGPMNAPDVAATNLYNDSPSNYPDLQVTGLTIGGVSRAMQSGTQALVQWNDANTGGVDYGDNAAYLQTVRR